jgi:integrase/recombinase XerD
MTINRYRYFYERAFSLFGDHTRCLIEKLAEQEHAASTIKLYLSCINDVAKAMDAAGLSAYDLDEPRAIELVAAMGWIQSRETYANFMMKRFVSFLADRGVGRERPALSPKEVARSGLRAAYEDYLRRQRGLSERTIIDSWRFAEQFLDFRFPEDADVLGKISVSDIARFLQARTVNKAPRDKTVPSHVKVALCAARFFLDGDGAHDFEDTLTLHPLGLETRRLTDMPEEILSLPGAAHKGHRP